MDAAREKIAASPPYLVRKKKNTRLYQPTNSLR